MNELKPNLLRLNMQYFAEGAEPSTESATEPTEANPNTQGGEPAKEKTFTQADVNSMLAGEKKQARLAVLKSLGFNVSDDTKYSELIKQAKETLDSQKTQQQLDNEAKTTAETEAAEAKKEASLLRASLEAIKFGVKPECVDDLISLILPKVTETETFEKLLKDYQTKYPMFYGKDEPEPKPEGTGRAMNPPKKLAGTESLGARLAKANAPKQTKSSYFKR